MILRGACISFDLASIARRLPHRTVTMSTLVAISSVILAALALAGNGMTSVGCRFTVDVRPTVAASAAIRSMWSPLEDKRRRQPLAEWPPLRSHHLRRGLRSVMRPGLFAAAAPTASDAIQSPLAVEERRAPLHAAPLHTALLTAHESFTAVVKLTVGARHRSPLVVPSLSASLVSPDILPDSLRLFTPAVCEAAQGQHAGGPNRTDGGRRRSQVHVGRFNRTSITVEFSLLWTVAADDDNTTSRAKTKRTIPPPQTRQVWHDGELAVNVASLHRQSSLEQPGFRSGDVDGDTILVTLTIPNDRESSNRENGNQIGLCAWSVRRTEMRPPSAGDESYNLSNIVAVKQSIVLTQDRGNRHHRAHRQIRSDFFRIQQQPSAPSPTTVAEATEVRVLQLIDAATQPTMVFLSGGYRYTEKAVFFNDVERSLRALREKTATSAVAAATAATSGTAVPVALDPEPWPRYLPLFNIFAIFEPSTESGASIAVGPGHECDPTVSNACPMIAEHRENNLQCSYGTPQPRRLNCDFIRIVTLASRAPPAEAIVVLVNDVRYGGTGGGGVAVVSTGEDLPYLLLHELGHAIGGLADEYGYGMTTASAAALTTNDETPPPNCAAVPTIMVNGRPTPAVESLPWFPWIQNKLADTVPQPGCTFDNYVRPTATSCIMRAKANGLCAVCKEAMSLALLRKRNGGATATSELQKSSGNAATYAPTASDAPTNSNPTSSALGRVDLNVRVALDAPRCPPDGFEVYLTADSSATLSINHRFAVLNGNVSVMWLIGNETIPALPSILVRGSDLPRGPLSILVRILDSSPLVLPTRRPQSMNYTALFLLRVVNENAALNCSELSCVASTGATYKFCGRCQKEGGCDKSWVATPVEYLPESIIDFSQAATVVSTTAIVLVVVGVIAIIATASFLCYWSRAQPVMFIIYSRRDHCLTAVTIFVSLSTFGLSLAVILVACYYFPRLSSTMGADVFIAALVIGAVVYLASAASLCCAAGRGVIGLVATAIVLTVFSLGSFALGAFCFYLVVHNGDASVTDWYRTQWMHFVATQPGRVCQVQHALECSGFDSACMPLPTPQCPANCDVQNRHTDPCLTRWSTFVHDALYIPTIVILAFAVLLLVNMIVNVSLAMAIRKRRRTARGRRSYRRDPRAPVAALTDDELELVREAFYAADADGSGTLQPAELRVFMRRVLGTDVTAMDEEMVSIALARRQEEYDRTHGSHALVAAASPHAPAYHAVAMDDSGAAATGLGMPLEDAAAPGSPGGSMTSGSDHRNGGGVEAGAYSPSSRADIILNKGGTNDGGDGHASPPLHRSPPTAVLHDRPTSAAIAPRPLSAQAKRMHPSVGLTFQDVMAIFFPFIERDKDPRLLSTDEAEAAATTADLVRLQLAKMEAYMEAAGSLSPSQLRELHRSHCRAGVAGGGEVQATDEGKDFISVVRAAADAHRSTVEAAMCQGLTYHELEGLRCAWSELHPAIDGGLSDVELELFYSKTHDGSAIVSRDHFVRWKAALDVRGTHRVEFAEYCFPFAQRALLRIAKSELARRGREVMLGPGQKAVLTRQEAEEQFGETVAAAAFLPYETMIPVERILAVTLRGR